MENLELNKDVMVNKEDFNKFKIMITNGFGWIDDSYIEPTWNNMFNEELNPEKLEYLKDKLSDFGLLES